MLIVGLRRLMDGLGRARNKKVTVSEVARATQIHRKIVSRIYNHPHTSVKGETIDQLAQYFLAEFALIDKGKKGLKALMEEIVKHLVVIFPDDDSVGATLINKASLGSTEGRYLAVTHLWDSFEKLPEKERSSRRQEWLTKHEALQAKLKPKPRKKRKKPGLLKQLG